MTKEVIRRGNRVFPLPGQPHGPWHSVFAEFFDWNDPPLFKNLLRLDASVEQLSITCYAATGCVDDMPPTSEDQISYGLSAGSWMD